MKSFIIGITVFIALLAALYYIDERRGVHDTSTPLVIDAQSDAPSIQDQKSRQYRSAPEITRPSGYVNTDGVTFEELIGKKVVLVDIMTYSCINCQRTFPYVNAWYEKYKDQGLEIVGIHTPEFQFEHDINNVREAMQRFGIQFPVVLDNDYGTWNAFNNRYWPRKYLIDIDGFVVYDHIGEGAYDKTEQKIQELLKERNDRLQLDESIASDVVAPFGVESVNRLQPQSPETYFGLLRNANQGQLVSREGDEYTFELPRTIVFDQLYLVGTWKITGEYAEAVSDDARIVYKYRAQKVFLVASSDSSVQAQVRVDDTPIGNRGGVHVVDSTVTVQNEQLYRIVEDESYGEHLLEIRAEPGLRAFAFTFG
jgi:thiol-disulfide isomerase/thioredoxin